jgi:hypothetical protein
VTATVPGGAPPRRAARRRVVGQERLAHHRLAGEHVLHRPLEVALVDALAQVGPGLGGGRRGGLEHRVLDVAAARRVARGERVEVDVVGQRRALGVHLHAPDARALGRPRHLEQHVRADAPPERRVEVGRPGWWRTPPRR